MSSADLFDNIISNIILSYLILDTSSYTFLQTKWGFVLFTGIPLFIHGGAKGIDAYSVAAFLMAAGNQSFMANSHGRARGCPGLYNSWPRLTRYPI